MTKVQLYHRIGKFCLLISAFIVLLPQGNAQEPSKLGEWMGRERALGDTDRVVSGKLGYSYGQVAYSTSEGPASYGRHAAVMDLNIRIAGKLWVRSTHFFDLYRSPARPQWVSELFYGIGYYDWRDGSWSFGYENYRPNVRKRLGDRFFTEMKRGYFFLSYKLLFEGKGEGFFWGQGSKLDLSPFLHFYPEYPTPTGGTQGYSKPVIGTELRYTIRPPFYLEGGLHFYPIPEQKLPWDPDLTYGFGLYDWRAFTLNVSYGNWFGTRFPWNPVELPEHGFLNGRFEVYMNYAF